MLVLSSRMTFTLSLNETGQLKQQYHQHTQMRTDLTFTLFHMNYR
jgi:hypothetical protein